MIFFYFLKIIFDISTSKTIQNIQIIFNFNKKKFKFFKITAAAALPSVP
jgi:hypothetical protein